jgi:hypothetical protein
MQKLDFQKDLNSVLNFSNPVSVYFILPLIQSPWFQFEYLNQILDFQFCKVPKTQFDLVLFWVQFKIDLKEFKPLVLNWKSFNQIRKENFATHFFFFVFGPNHLAAHLFWFENSSLASPSMHPIRSTLWPNLAHLGIIFLTSPRAATAAVLRPHHHRTLRRAAPALHTEDMSHHLTLLLFRIKPKPPHCFDSL